MRTDPRRRRPAVLHAGLALFGLLAFVALAAPLLASTGGWLVGHAPQATDLGATLRPPSAAHWLGTDPLGRDLSARLIHGTRVSLSVGLLTALFGLALGIPLGAAGALCGGWVDRATGAIGETLLCFPTLLLVLAVLHSGPAWLARLPDTLRIAMILGVTASPAIARYARAELLRLRQASFVEAASAAGCPPARLLALHLLPGTLAPVSVAAAFTVAGAIALEAALSFLGLGVPPPTPSWGALLADAQDHVDHAWWLALFPGLALFVAVLASNLVGEGLRQQADPRRLEILRR